MLTPDLIDKIEAYTDNVDPTDLDYADRRARILQLAQEVVDDVWHFRDFSLKQRTTTMTVTSGQSSCNLPADLGDTGDLGGVFLNGILMEEVYPIQLIQLKEGLSGANGYNADYVYAIFSEGTTTPYLRKLQTTTRGSNTTYNIYYSATPPTLSDTTDDPAGESLSLIPAQYHNTVLIPGVMAKVNRGKGDTRDFLSSYQRGLSLMVLRERPRKGMVQRLPPVIRAW